MTQRGPLARESLALQMLETTSQPERLTWLAQVVPGLQGSGVIYVLTVADTKRVASFLRTQVIDAHAYSGETESERRLELEDALIANEVKRSWPPRPSGSAMRRDGWPGSIPRSDQRTAVRTWLVQPEPRDACREYGPEEDPEIPREARAAGGRAWRSRTRSSRRVGLPDPARSDRAVELVALFELSDASDTVP